MGLSSIVSRIVPIALGAAQGGPIGAFAAGVATEESKKARKRIIREQEAQAAQQQRFLEDYSMAGLDAFGGIGRPITPTAVATQQSGGTFIDTLRGGLREFGGFTRDLFSSGIPQFFGFNRPPSVGQQPAVTTVTNVGAQESQGSGTVQAGFGAALPSILGGARSLLKSPMGQLALGGGAAGAISFLGSDGKQMRITRKMKSQARMVLNLAQGNISVAADILNISEDMLVTILLKRFRNDGPVVTKAALRKTKQTIRRLHSMQDVLKSITPTATMRRRAPMKRASTTTLIKN